MDYLIVNKPIAPIYFMPNIKSELVDEVLYGMVLKVVKIENKNWYFIRTEYNYEGYLHRKFVINLEKRVNKWNNINKKLISSNYCDVLDGAKIQSKIITTLPKGSVIAVTEKSSNDKEWSQVLLVNGLYGWVRTANLRDNVNNEEKDKIKFRDNLVNDALSYLGTQYRWGGKTHLGIDCSGLCSIVYMLNRVNIYRDADIVDGFPIKEISINDIKKGDLIFFPGHVAMYIGNGKYIHASLSGNGVRINSLNDDDDDYREDLAKTILKVGSLYKKG